MFTIKQTLQAINEEVLTDVTYPSIRCRVVESNKHTNITIHYESNIAQVLIYDSTRGPKDAIAFQAVASQVNQAISDMVLFGYSKYNLDENYQHDVEEWLYY